MKSQLKLTLGIVGYLIVGIILSLLIINLAVPRTQLVGMEHMFTGLAYLMLFMGAWICLAILYFLISGKVKKLWLRIVLWIFAIWTLFGLIQMIVLIF